MKPTLDNIVKLLIGKTAKANHPITVLNPDETFVITDAHVDYTFPMPKVFCQGKNTAWFGENMVEILDV